MPTVVVHDLQQATAAAAAAAALSRALVIQTPPAAGRSLGVAGWLALADATRQAVPTAEIAFCLDCAELPGDAYAAIRMGAERIALAPSPARDRISQIANFSGVRLEEGLPDLDLAFNHDPKAAVSRLLSNHT